MLLDALLLFVFFIDLTAFVRQGYETTSLLGPATSAELPHALFHAVETSIFMFLFLPIVVASVRIIATRLKLPALSWRTRRIFTVHALITLLVGIGIVACVRMEIASGLKFAFDTTQSTYISSSYVYTSDLEYVPLVLNDAIVRWLPSYIVSWHFMFLLAGIGFSYITGREILRNQRNFISDYAAASKLADCDPGYLPTSKARCVALVRSCAPLTNAVEGAIEHELHSFSFGRNESSDDDGDLATHVRTAVASYLFGDSHGDKKVRMLPDTLSCIYSAISNEENCSSVILSSANHPGINEPVAAWFGRNRSVKIVGIDEQQRLEPWSLQQRAFIQAVAASVSAETKVLIVLPLVSFWTGQIFEVRTLIEQIRAWSKNVTVVLDGSFLNVSSGSTCGDLYGADYLSLNISQWLTCSESCGVLVSKKWLTFDPDWERQVACAPANIRTLSAFKCALDHSFKRSAWFNDPQSRSEILISKFCDVIDPRLLSVVEIPGLTVRSYFLTVEPSRGKNWEPGFANKIRGMGLGSSLLQSGPVARLTLAFPPYVDFWQVKTLAVALSQSIV